MMGDKIPPHILFEQFLRIYPPSVQKKPVIDFSFSYLFIDIYENHWKYFYLKQLLVWKNSDLSQNDPALHRGDEIDLFRPYHETDFSNWMRWLLSEENPASNVLQSAVLSEIYPNFKDLQLPILNIEREVGVEKGHEEHSGSLDLLLMDPNKQFLIVIENKTRKPEKNELMKHKGYRESIEKKYTDFEHKPIFILLVPDIDDVDVETNEAYGNFELAEWADVARSLRRQIMEGNLKYDPANEILTGLFIAAIESYLLGYPVSAWRKILNSYENVKNGDLLLSAKAIASHHYYKYLEDFYENSK